MQDKFLFEMFCMLNILFIFAARNLPIIGKNGNLSKKTSQQDADREPRFRQKHHGRNRLERAAFDDQRPEGRR